MPVAAPNAAGVCTHAAAANPVARPAYFAVHAYAAPALFAPAAAAAAADVGAAAALAPPSAASFVLLVVAA